MNVAGTLPLLPSVTDGLATETASGSSSVIVSGAEASPIVAAAGSDSATESASSGSTAVSPRTATWTMPSTSPGANVNRPEAGA